MLARSQLRPASAVAGVDTIDAATLIPAAIRSMRVTSHPDARKVIHALLARIGLNVGLKFTEGTNGPKRKVREPQSGVIAFNNTLFEQEFGRGGGRHGREDSEPGRKEKKRTSASRPNHKPHEGISHTKDNRGGQI